MKIRTVWVGMMAVLALAAGAGFAAPKEAAAPKGAAAVAEPTSPVRLELRLKPGESHRFRVTEDTVMKASMPGGGTRRTAKITTATFDLLVDRVNADGSYAVRVRPGSQTVTVNGKDTPPDAPTTEATATLGRDGRLSNVSDPQPGEDEAEAGFDAREMLETLFDEDAGFPAQPVPLGGGWKDKIESPLDESAARVTVNNTLVALDVLEGKQVARVLNIAAEPIEAPADESGVAMSGTLEGGGLANIDLATGLPLESRDTVRMRVTVTGPAPVGEGTISIESEVHVKFHLRAIPSGGA